MVKVLLIVVAASFVTFMINRAEPLQFRDWSSDFKNQNGLKPRLDLF